MKKKQLEKHLSSLSVSVGRQRYFFLNLKLRHHFAFISFQSHFNNNQFVICVDLYV